MIAYHVIAEGAIGRANQTFVADEFECVGAFPGLQQVQRFAVGDEVRHIGISVSYARRRLERAAAVIYETGGVLLLRGRTARGRGSAMAPQSVGAYGAEPARDVGRGS